MLPRVERWIYAASLFSPVSQLKELLRMAWPGRDEYLVEPEMEKTYQRPVARRLTPEQARLVLIGHATVGNQGARELMAVVFMEPNTPCWGGDCGPGGTPSAVYGGYSAHDCP